MEHDNDLTRLERMSEAEILEHFRRYGFTDALGHDLIHCQDFLVIVRRATRPA